MASAAAPALHQSGTRHPRPRVAEAEQDGAHRQVDLPRQRDRGQREPREQEAAPLEREQRRGQQKRDQAEQVPGRLADTVRGEREDEPARERRSAREAERPQPQAAEAAGGDEGEKHDQVVRPDVTERAVERPGGKPEEPALQVRRRRCLRPERVRVGPRRCAALELVAGQPERPGELQVVAGGRSTFAGGGACEVVAVHVADRRPGRPDGTGGIDDER